MPRHAVDEPSTKRGLTRDQRAGTSRPLGQLALGAIDLERFDKARSGIEDSVTDAVEALADGEVKQDERVREAVRGALRQRLDLPRSRRPIVEVQITRLSAEALDALEDVA